MEFITFGLFLALLLTCVVLDISVLAALVGGLLVFWGYGRLKGFGWRELAAMSWSGVRTVRNILITFFLIGMLTALWRACGTIPVIVCYAAKLIRPEIFVLLTFLLNSLMSVLTGTSFGTAATMGVICMSVANAMGISPFWVGGAILSGVFVGDRCSPVSTSALLVSTLTETDIYDNIRAMLRTALVPFLLSCGIYLWAGARTGGGGGEVDVQGMFLQEFRLSPVCLLPAAVILVLALCRVNVRRTMLASIVLAFLIAMTVQGLPVSRLFSTLVSGYRADDPALSALMNGGGILSMVRVAAIVCIAASYSGIFRDTGLLGPIQGKITALARRATPTGAVILTSAAAAAVSCNQSLAIMLTHQLCGCLEEDKSRLAILLEDTVVVIAPMIPWSIAGAVPLASAGAPTVCILASCFLYLLPLYRLVVSLIRDRRGAAA